MIEIPQGKVYGQTRPYTPNIDQLTKFIFAPENKALKEAFEKAAGVELQSRDRDIHFFADSREQARAAGEALEQLAGAVKLAIEPEKFDAVLKTLKP